MKKVIFFCVFVLVVAFLSSCQMMEDSDILPTPQQELEGNPGGADDDIAPPR